jgi:hypothetical protein
MLSQLFVLRRSKNFTSNSAIRMPPSVPLSHYLDSENQQNRTEVLFHYSMQHYSRAKACFEHSNFLRVKLPAQQRPLSKEQTARNRKKVMAGHGSARTMADHRPQARDPTTSFLTATTYVHARGAGITAAAGTRLALHWILVKGFKVYSFQLPA